MTKASAGRRRRRALLRVVPPPETRITKFVEAAFYEPTRRGELKFGTLASYRLMEAGAAHRLSDRDGTFTHFSSQPMRGETLQIGGMDLSGNYVSGAVRGSVAVNTEVECLVFCATRMGYRRVVHDRMLAKNPELTHYVVFDTAKFKSALCELYSAAWPGEQHAHDWEDIRYDAGDRSEDSSLQQLSQQTDQERIRDALYRKPSDFSHEEEIRFVLWPRPASNEHLFVKNLNPRVAQLFANAVVGSGSRPT